MSVTIRGMITHAKDWRSSATFHTRSRKFKAWPNGHVRVDGVHRTIAQAESDLYEAIQEDKHGKCWRACPDMLCDDCKVERGLV